MIDWFLTNLQTNEVMQAAVVAAPATALTYAARNIPVKIWNSIKHFFSYDLVFRSDQQEYYYVNQLVGDKVVSEKWSREFAYEHITLWDDQKCTDEDMFIGMSIGYGRHWGSYEGHPVLIHRQMDEDSQTEHFKETLTLSFIGRSNTPARKFCGEIASLMESRKQSDRIKLKVSSNGGWINHGFLSPRPLSSVFTNGNIKEQAVKFVTDFEDSREECVRKGIPWHAGMLLKGPPGGGKTSLIHAIASETGRDIRFLNLAGLKDDREIAYLLAGNGEWHKCFLVIEDIDTARARVSREDNSDGVALASLLNVIDGFLTPEGLITIATTNHAEKLDPALVRSGRFDFQAELGPLEWEQAEDMTKLLTGEVHRFGSSGQNYVPVMGADLRKTLLAGPQF